MIIKICRRFSLFVILLTILCVRVQAQPTVQVELLGQTVVPYNKMVQGTPVGGLSGLTYDENADKFYAISDDRSRNARARFYSFRIVLTDDDSLKAGAIQWIGKTILKAADGKPYPKNLIDPEGIALGPDSLIYVSSEGVPGMQAAPFINGYNRMGKLVRKLPIPEAYWSAQKPENSRGVRTNLGFEGLAVSPDGSKLYTATENALWQDGPAADSAHTSPARLMVYDLPSGQVRHEFWYSVDPIYRLSSRNKGFAVNGLTDLVALDNQDNLLAIERNFVQGEGNRIRLYQLTTECATDVNGLKSLKDTKQLLFPVNKWLIADIAHFGIMIDNFEGLSLGPELEGGGRLLLMVSDNNFSASQKTIFTAFRLRM